MKNLKIKQFIAVSAAATITLFFSQSVMASTGMDSIGTGSTGSYSHGAHKSEGSSSKKSHHISGKKSHYKKEGSGSKSYTHHGKSHGKSKGHRYSHRKSEGSGHKKHGSHGYSKSRHGGHGGHGKHSSKCPFTHLLRFKDKLGLTEAQIAKIKELRFEYQKQSVRNKADHKIAHMEFDRLVHAKNIDAQAIRAAAGKIAGTKTQMIMATAEAKIALLNLLTDAQRSKAHAMHSAHSSH